MRIQSIMSTHAERFTGRASDYDRYRQRYPADTILTSLRAWCGLTSQQLVADIGAGTGMLAEVFLANENRVIAVEPNEEMRHLCESMTARWPSLSVIDATAERTTLDDHSIDIVAVGRAFHWFDRDRALAEFRRILKPDGWVVLVSVGRAKNDTPQANDFETLLTEYGTDYTYVRSGYRIHENLHEFFPRDWHQQQVPGTAPLDWQSFYGQALSLSMVPMPGHERFPAFVEALRAYFQRYAVNGTLTMATTCWISAGRFASQQ